MSGFVYVYTGNGKGKTTSALGLSIKEAGMGNKVYIAQFMKGQLYSEIRTLQCLTDLITVEQYGLSRFIGKTPSAEDIHIAQKGIEMVKSVILSGRFDMVVLDEANTAIKCHLIEEQAILDLMEIKPPALKLVITGRGATEKIIEKADHVFEMKAIKHYYEQGVPARVGIEK